MSSQEVRYKSSPGPTRGNRKNINACLLSPDNKHDTKSQKSCLTRWFGTMGPGSFRASILSLMAAAIGGGMLCLPFVFKNCGVILGVLLLVMGFCSTLWSFGLIIKADAYTGQHTNYRSFCIACGGKNLGRLYDFAFIYSTFGNLLGFQIIIAILVRGLIRNYGIEEAKDFHCLHVISFSIGIIFPICSLKNGKIIQSGALISIGAIAFLIFFLIIELPFSWVNNRAKDVVYFNIDWTFFTAFAITMCHVGFFAAIENTFKRDVSHMRKMVNRGVTTNMIFCIIVAVCGYLSGLKQTQEVVIGRGKNQSPAGWPEMFGQALVICALIIRTPLMFIPLRNSIFALIFRNPEITPIRAITSSILFTIVTCLLTIVIPRALRVFTCVGGIGGVCLCYIVPVWAYLAQIPVSMGTKIRYIGICVIISIAGLTAATRAYYGILEENSYDQCFGLSKKLF